MSKIKETRYRDIHRVEVVDAKPPIKKPTSKLSTLDDIEEKMLELANDDTNDLVRVMTNEKKIAMLEKVANIKMRRLQLQELEKQNMITPVEPIAVRFVNSKSDEQNERLEHTDKEIASKRTIRQDA